MTQKIFNKKPENSKHAHAPKNTICVTAVKIGECSGCGKDNAEYILEDSQLCLDCYRTEIEYWAKSDIPRIS